MFLVNSYEFDFLARMAVGKQCPICSTQIQKGEKILIGQRSKNVLHEDCYNIVERHQAKTGIKERLEMSQSMFEEIDHNPKLKFDDAELSRK